MRMDLQGIQLIPLTNLNVWIFCPFAAYLHYPWDLDSIIIIVSTSGIDFDAVNKPCYLGLSVSDLSCKSHWNKSETVTMRLESTTVCSFQASLSRKAFRPLLGLLYEH